MSVYALMTFLLKVLMTKSTKNLEAVLNRLEKAGILLKLSNCEFMLPSVEFLGHRISANGLKLNSKKIKAIKEAMTPTNLSQLKSFLDVINYYAD